MTIAKEPREDQGTRTPNAVDTRNGRARVQGPSKLHVGMSFGFAALSNVRHVSTCVSAQGTHVQLLPHD